MVDLIYSLHTLLPPGLVDCGDVLRCLPTFGVELTGASVELCLDRPSRISTGRGHQMGQLGINRVIFFMIEFAFV